MNRFLVLLAVLGVNPANAGDALSKALIIGDSISIGYTKPASPHSPKPVRVLKLFDMAGAKAIFLQDKEKTDSGDGEQTVVERHRAVAARTVPIPPVNLLILPGEGSSP